MVPPPKQYNWQDISTIIHAYSKRLIAYAFYFLKNQEEAADVAQEVFIQFWEKKSLQFSGEKALESYLFAMVRNACLNKIEKENVQEQHLSQLNHSLLEEVAATFDESLIRQIFDEIEQMPPQTRNIIQGVFIRNQKYQEIADELGISVNTVKSLLKKGLKHLRSRFSGKLELFLVYLVKSCHTGQNPTPHTATISI